MERMALSGLEKSIFNTQIGVLEFSSIDRTTEKILKLYLCFFNTEKERKESLFLSLFVLTVLSSLPP